MRLSQQASPGSLANSRKRRNSHPRGCGCHSECDTLAARACKRQNTNDDDDKSWRSRLRLDHFKRKVKQEEEKEETEEEKDTNKSSAEVGRRRSLRIKENLKYRGLSDVNNECDSHKDKGNREKRDALRSGKHVSFEFVEKEEEEFTEDRRAKRSGVCHHQSDNGAGVEGNRVESWDTRLRHRLRNSNSKYIKHQIEQVKEEEEEEEEEEDIDVGRRGRKRKRERDLHACNGPGSPKGEPQYDSETKDFHLPSWARKSKRKRRLQNALGAENVNNLPDLNLEQPNLYETSGEVPSQADQPVAEEVTMDRNQASTRRQNTDSEGTDKEPSVSDQENHDSKLFLNKRSMADTLAFKTVQIDNDAGCKAKGQLEIQGRQHANHSSMQGLQDLTSHIVDMEILQTRVEDGQGMAWNSRVSDSEDSSRDLAGEAKHQDFKACRKGFPINAKHHESKGFSRVLNHIPNPADFENAKIDLGVQSKHQGSTSSFPLVFKSSDGIRSSKAILDASKTRPRVFDADPDIDIDKIDVDRAPLELSETDGSMRHHSKDPQLKVGDDITESNVKHVKVPEHEVGQETLKAGEFYLSQGVKDNNNKAPKMGSNAGNLNFDKPAIIEGRKCGLCGVGNDGKPPRKLSQENTDSDNELYGELQALTEEPKYKEEDGFGNDPGWLGRLLGPLSDRYGIAGVWVHKQCAVWSPEVYFSGVGCLKNVRAALARGRSLKCSRCDRPGATIGCRVDRCPRTYHLACGRAEGCVFDHKKYLMACTDHLHLFRPRVRTPHEMQKMRLRKLFMERSKDSTAALRKDLEAEEKWLENCGEDEEFLRRERKRLHRDVARIAPVYIGGSSSDSAKFSEGWESVAGLENVINCMKEVMILPLLYPEYFDSLGITPPRGVLLHGYPGTGKTLAVRALIGACARGDRRIAYFSRKGADCLGKYVGDAERQLRLLFQVAEQCQPSVIFFDEIDGLAPKRSRQQDQTHSSVVSTLLALMDGLRSRGSVIVIGATNCPEHLDPALRRPGRFDREIYFPLPSVKQRAAILGLHTRKWPKPPSVDVLARVAQQTPGYAGADLQALCTQAVMIALKRNFSLQDLFLYAEKKLEVHQLPSLPPILVKENDWAIALAQAPPPCSRRASSMAVNDVNALPLQRHMASVLLQPLVELLASLYRDGRIVLPPVLFKATKLIESKVTSILEQKSPLTIPWWSSLKSLFLGSKVVKDIEKSLSSIGFICNGIESLSSDLFLSLADEEIIQNIEDSSYKTVENDLKDMEKLKLWGGKGRGIGFRVLIAGDPKSGQKYLASCILHGFEGYVEIRKLNLSTMFQEGHGDIIQGLTHILGTCRNIGSCVVFMPKIEAWALETKDDETGIISASSIWNVLVQQVDSIPVDVPLVFLATCELPGLTLPLQIRNFFINVAANASSFAFNKNAPCFYVQLPTTFDCNLLFDQCAKNITLVAIKSYIQFIHHACHHDSITMRKSESALSHGNLAPENRLGCWSKAGIERKDTLVGKPKNQVHHESGSGSYKGSQNHSGGVKDNMPQSDVEVHHFNMNDRNNWQEQWPIHFLHKTSYLASGKGRTVLQQAIATCGYQLLCHPQFAELCWVTSKLKEGPCTTPDGPWKGWPFNSCIVDTNSSQMEVQSGDSCGEHKDRAFSSVVRGIIAVGLLAYKGLYNTGKEVACDVRKVLELLVGKIKTKIRNGKDKYQFFPLLAQASSLEDMVNNWAYAIQSLEVNTCTSEAVVTPSISGRPEPALHGLNGNTVVDHGKVNVQACADTCLLSDSNCKRVPASDSSIPNIPIRGGSGPAVSNIYTEDVLSPRSLVQDTVLLEDNLTGDPQVVYTNDNVPLHCVAQNYMDLTKAVDNHDLEGLLEKPASGSMPANGLIFKDALFSGSEIPANVKFSQPLSTNNYLHNSENVSLRCHGDLEDVSGGNIDPANRKDNNDSLSNSRSRCVYRCCFDCIQTVHKMVKQFLKNCWKSEGSSSRLEDFHDLVASCTVNILSVVAQFRATGSRNKLGSRQWLAILFDQVSCSCQNIGDNQPMQTLPVCKRNTRYEEILLRACKCHASPRKKNARRKHSPDMSWLETNLEFAFVDHMCNTNLKSMDQTQDLHFHCQTEQFCLCSLIQKLSNIRKPLH